MYVGRSNLRQNYYFLKVYLREGLREITHIHKGAHGEGQMEKRILNRLPAKLGA